MYKHMVHTAHAILKKSLLHIPPTGTDLSTPRSIHMSLHKSLHFTKPALSFVKWATLSQLD